MRAISQKKRLLTAAVGLPVLIAAVAVGGWPLWIVLAAAALVGMEEFFTMVGHPGPVFRLVAFGLGLAAVAGAAVGGLGWLVVPPLCALWIEQFDFLRRFGRLGDKTLPRGVLVAAVLYIPTTLAVLACLAPLETFFILAVVMATDTGAYYGGFSIGGPKIWPSVSPAKTVSGSLCGLAAGVLVGSAFGLFAVRSAGALAGLAAVMSVVSQGGDFFESALKRAVGVKDSGRVLPGHGGVLDRIDGLLPAVLVYAACRTWWGLAG